MTPVDVSAPPKTDWLATLRNARSIAIVGASDDVKRPGGRAIAALRSFGFAGRIYPVNPGRTEIQGLPCAASVTAIGRIVDVVFVLVSAAQAVDVTAECSAIGVPLVIVGTAGFRESGAAGVLLEAQLANKISDGTRVVGPNTNGLAWMGTGAVVCFSPALQQHDLDLADGPVAIVSQSGALGAATFTIGQAAGLDIGLMVNTGNEVDLGLEEVLTRLCAADSGIDVVLSYVEGLSDPAGLLVAARSAAARGVVLVMLKVGTTEAGMAAAAAHTAKLAGADRTFDGVLTQLGIIRAATLSELTGVGIAARSKRALSGGRVTVASLSGGLGIIVADAVGESGSLTMAHWSTGQQAALDGLLPAYLGRSNPVDLGGGPFWDLPVLQKILGVIDSAPESDLTVLAVANFEGSQDAISEAIETVALNLAKPLFVVWYGNAARSRRRLSRSGIPAFAEPAEAVRAIAALAGRSRTARVLAEDSDVDVPRRAEVRDLIAGGSGEVLGQGLTQKILCRYGIPLVEQYSWPVAAEPPDLWTFPCYVKLSAPVLLHKSDVGAVVRVATVAEAQSSILRLRDLAGELGLADAEITVQGHVGAGSELLLGMSQDPVFGAVLTVGLGGVLAEALDDVAVRLPVLNADDVRTMLLGLRNQALVRGFRGLPPVDAPALINAVLSFSRLVHEVGDRLAAVDINPIIVGDDGAATVVDMLMVRR